MVTKKNVSLLLFLFAFLFACTDDHVVLEKDEDEKINILEDHKNPQGVKDKNGGAGARIDIPGANVTLTVDSPVDPSGNVIISSSGTTQVNFRVIIRRNSTSDNVHLQFQIRNSNLTSFWTSAVIRTLDFPNNQLEKTLTGSINVTAGSVNQGSYDLCLFTRDFLGAQDYTGECKNTLVSTLPVPGVGEIEPDWIFDNGTCAFRESECVPRSFTVFLGTGGDIPGGSIYWSGGESHINWLPGSLPPENLESIRFITKSGVNFPVTFTITARVTKPGYSDVIRTRTLTLYNCCYIED